MFNIRQNDCLYNSNISYHYYNIFQQMQKVSEQHFIKILKELLQQPIYKRTETNLAKLIDLVRQLKYFHDMAEMAGNRILFEYCKVIELIHLSSNTNLQETEDFYVVVKGKLISRNKVQLSLLNEYSKGNCLKSNESNIEIIAQQETYLLKIHKLTYKKIQILQKNAISSHKKRVNMVKNLPELTYILEQIKHSTLFQHMPFYDLLEIVSKSHLHHFKKGQVIYHQNTYPFFLHYLIKGVVSIKHNQDKEQIINKYSINKRLVNTLATAIVNQYQVFGIEEIITQKFYQCQAVAFSSDAEVALIEVEIFRKKFNNIYTNKIFQNMIGIVQARKSMIQKLKNSKRQKQKSYDEILEVQHAKNVLKNRIEFFVKKQQKNHALRSNMNPLPVEYYLPKGLFHKQRVDLPKFTGITLNLDLFSDSEGFKAKRTLSPILNQQKKTKKYIYQKIIINKLEQYESLDKQRLLHQSMQLTDTGATINFFKKPPRYKKVVKNLSQQKQHSKQLKDIKQ